MAITVEEMLSPSPTQEVRRTRSFDPLPTLEAGRMSQLDGLRALAALTVIVHHNAPHSKVTDVVDLGAAAVWLFFVLSGFLITGILIRSRQAAERSGVPWLGVARSFYTRRFLRIMPLYYLVVVISLIANLPGARRYVVWDLFYCTNILTSFAPGVTVSQYHFWSLCVEEQFYLVWPAMILLVPWRWLVPLVSGMILLGPLSRLAFIIAFPESEASYFATPSCLDCLGLGALLALRRERGQGSVPVPLWLGAACSHPAGRCLGSEWDGGPWLLCGLSATPSSSRGWLATPPTGSEAPRAVSWLVGRWFTSARSAMASTSTTWPFRSYGVTGVCHCPTDP